MEWIKISSNTTHVLVALLINIVLYYSHETGYTIALNCKDFKMCVGIGTFCQSRETLKISQTPIFPKQDKILVGNGKEKSCIDFFFKSHCTVWGVRV